MFNVFPNFPETESKSRISRGPTLPTWDKEFVGNKRRNTKTALRNLTRKRLPVSQRGIGPRNIRKPRQNKQTYKNRLKYILVYLLNMTTVRKGFPICRNLFPCSEGELHKTIYKLKKRERERESTDRQSVINQVLRQLKLFSVLRSLCKWFLLSTRDKRARKTSARARL